MGEEGRGGEGENKARKKGRCGMKDWRMLDEREEDKEKEIYMGRFLKSYASV